MSTPHVEHHHDNSHALGENATLHEPISADGTPEIGKTYTVPARNGRAVKVQSPRSAIRGSSTPVTSTNSCRSNMPAHRSTKSFRKPAIR
jgi:hypothetical protein